MPRTDHRLEASLKEHRRIVAELKERNGERVHAARLRQSRP